MPPKWVIPWFTLYFGLSAATTGMYRKRVAYINGCAKPLCSLINVLQGLSKNNESVSFPLFKVIVQTATTRPVITGNFFFMKDIKPNIYNLHYTIVNAILFSN